MFNLLLNYTLFSSRICLASLALISLATGASVSWWAGDWSWFQRTGSLSVLFGGLMTFREPFSRGLFSTLYTSTNPKNTTLTGFHAYLAKNFTAQFGHSGIDTDDSKFARSGIILMILGTLIWGFGDLLDHLPFLQ